MTNSVCYKIYGQDFNIEPESVQFANAVFHDEYRINDLRSHNVRTIVDVGSHVGSFEPRNNSLIAISVRVKTNEKAVSSSCRAALVIQRSHRVFDTSPKDCGEPVALMPMAKTDKNG